MHTIKDKQPLKVVATLLVVGLVVTSCYKIIRTEVPREVYGTEPFEARMVVCDDGSDTQNFTTDWSVAAIRVPEGWTVTVPKGCHRQYAEDWVYYSDGSQVNSSQNMKYNSHLSDIYNTASPKKGYKWWAFVSEKMIPKHMASCWRNGCDSIAVTFVVTPNGVPGTYQIDFIAGDEENEKGVSKYNTYSDAQGTRLFHAATVSSFAGNKKPDNMALSFSQKIIAYEDTGLQPIVEPEARSAANPTAVYDLDGRLVSTDATHLSELPAGLYIVGGEKVVKNERMKE